MSHIQTYLQQVELISRQIDFNSVELMVDALSALRTEGGRLFLLAVGGSAANASHAVNDFRKICGLESYAATDNVSELSARINDEGWESAFAAWLKGSKLQKKDGVFVLSVGGGSLEKKVSLNIVAALRFAKEVDATIFGIVGRDGGFTRKIANYCVVIPTVDASLVTFHAESFQSVLLHLMVSHPKLKQNETKWESIL